MKKGTKIIGFILVACVVVGGAYAIGLLDGAIIKAKALLGLEVEQVSGAYVVPEGATQVTGMVVTAYGNEITVQLAAQGASNTERMQDGFIQGEQREAAKGASTQSDTPKGGADNLPNRSSGNQESMKSAKGNVSGMPPDAATMQGGMAADKGNAAADASTDFSDTISLSDETQTFFIPTGTLVERYGFAMTFLQLEAEQYITMTISEDGSVLYVEVLG